MTLGRGIDLRIALLIDLRRRTPTSRLQPFADAARRGGG